MSDPIDHLSSLFEKLPGIGPRQAQRFVQYLLRSSPSLRHEMGEAIQHLSGSVLQCNECQRFFAGTSRMCGLCANRNRDAHVLAIVAADTDVLALERSGDYRGYYFVLGGTISLANERANHLRLSPLLAGMPARIQKGLKEIIFAFPANPEGDATAIRVHDELDEHLPAHGLKITSLGRGLSTGSELEYADPETLKQALASRR